MANLAYYVLLVFAVVFLVVYFGSQIVTYLLLRWTRKRLRNKKKKAWETNTEFSTCDVLPTNGINAVITHTWNFLLEPWLAYEGKLILQDVLDLAIEDGTYGIERLEIKELTWGIIAPKLSNIALQLLFPERHVRISFTMDFTSSDLDCLVSFCETMMMVMLTHLWASEWLLIDAD